MKGVLATMNQLPLKYVTILTYDKYSGVSIGREIITQLVRIVNKMNNSKNVTSVKD